jgi:hypothetical protein
MNSAIRILVVASLWAAGAIALSPHATAQDNPASCKAKVEKCMSQCLVNNPPNVCRRYCKTGLICG